MQQRYDWEGTHVILFIFPGFAVKDKSYIDMAKQIPVRWSRQGSRFKNSSGLEVFVNLHAWNHCPRPALSPKWLENYMEPHASSEILTRSDLTAWLNPKPNGFGPQTFSSCAGMLSKKILKISVLRFAENAFLTF